MQHALAHDRGKRKRQRNGLNEDSVAVYNIEDGHRDTSREVAAFILADGAGGEAAGDIASYIATTVIGEELQPLLQSLITEQPESMGLELPDEFTADRVSPDDIHDAIASAIRTAEGKIIEYTKAAGPDQVDPNDPFRAFTTAVVGVLVGDTMHYGWVGDSRAYVYNEQEDRLAPLTKDHSQVQEQLDAGMLNEVESLIALDGHVISRAVGGTALQEPVGTVDVPTDSVPLYDEDTILFTSDGLIDAYPHIEPLHNQYEQAETDAERKAAEEKIRETVVTDDDILQIIREHDSLSAGADRFIEFSNNKGGKDNISVILAEGDYLPSTPTTLPARGFEELAEKEIETQETSIISSGSSESDREDSEGDESQNQVGEESQDSEEVECEDSPDTKSAAEDTNIHDSSTESDDDVWVSREVPASSNNASESSAEDLTETEDGQAAHSASLINNTEDGKQYTITPGDSIGRGSDADITLDQAPAKVSRTHAVLKYSDSGWQIQDQATNETRVATQDDDAWTTLSEGGTQPLEDGYDILLGSDSDNIQLRFREE